ncbi:MAG: response regulator [Anaerolineae bacterium]|nr:response regulator [Anaerolineae bacterium]
MHDEPQPKVSPPPLLEHMDVLLQGFLAVAEFRDPQTGLHLERMATFCRLLAEEVAGHPRFPEAADPAWRDTLFHAAPLHDIGKIATPDRILLKPGKLTPSEFEVMKAHTTYGKSLLEGMSRRFPDGAPPVISLGMEVAAHHHERWDGLSYPDGLRGEEIALASRIAALADVYDAITSPRVYRPGRLSHEEALAFLQENRGKAFDPLLVEAFVAAEDAIRQEAERLADPVPTWGAGKQPPMAAREQQASILVVDDEPSILHLLQQYLSMEGYRVETASSVAEARRRLASGNFDLVTLDINMPGESGLTLLEELTPRMPDIMVLMMTAITDVRVGVETLKKGAFDYLVKPVDLEELGLTIAKALRHRELELENRAYLTRLELTVAHRTAELEARIRALEEELARLRQT